MLEIILIALYALIVGQIQKPFAKRIQESENIERAIRVRKKYKIVRYLSLLIFFVINFIASFIVQTYKADNINWVSIIMSTITTTLLAYVLAGGIYSHKEFNPISFLTVKDFEKLGGKYSLFLRGFNVDNYSSKQDVSIIKGHQFSEYTLARLMAKGSPLFAVGMTKELTSPEGAKRIYLSDDAWKDDVHELMQHAAAIYILVNGKESCVWEIEQSMALLEKTCFIVDDLAQYEIVKMKIGDKYCLPNLLSIDVPTPLAFRLHPNTLRVQIAGSENSDSISAQIYTFDNSKEGYLQFINDLYGANLK